MSDISFRNPANNGWTSLSTCTNVYLRNADNTAWIDKSSLRSDIHARSLDNTSWITAVAPYVPPNPYTLTLAHNDLDFIYSSVIPDVPTGNELRFSFDLNFGNFFTACAGGHIPFGINMVWNTPNNVHCGPIIRNGNLIFTDARGFIIALPATCSAFGLPTSDGVLFEYWNNSTTPALGVVTRTAGSGLNPLTNTNIHIKIDGWFHGTIYPNSLFITITDNVTSALLFQGVAGLGWDHQATYQSFVGAIGTASVRVTSSLSPPCVEPSGPAPGGSPTAYAVVSNMTQTCF